MMTENCNPFGLCCLGLNPPSIFPLQNNYNSPSKVDSVYTRSTPMMEAVKIGGRLDLIECLIAAGGRLDVQVGVSHFPLFQAVCRAFWRHSGRIVSSSVTA